MENEISNVLGAFHDGVIVGWEGDLSQLTLTIECQYLAELFQEGFDHFYIRLEDIELIAFEPWLAAGIQKAASKTKLLDIFAPEIEILSAKAENGIAVVACTLDDPKLDFVGGNLLIKANSFHLQNQNREHLTSEDLFAAASRYWDKLGRTQDELMLKIVIWPAFLNKSLFELKEDCGAWTLLLTKESHEHLQDRGGIWSHALAADKATQLTALAQSIIAAPFQDERLILDGVSVTLRLREEGEEIKHHFLCPVPGSNEFTFIAQLLALAEASIPEKECQDYLELLAPYFLDRSPFKEFNEEGYRLKIIGQLTSRDQEALEVKLQGLKNHASPILDMSNFLGTGRILDASFLAVQELKGLSIWVNAQSQNYLKEIGFDQSILISK